MLQQLSDPGQLMNESLCSALLHSLRAIVWECDPFTLRFYRLDPRAESILGYPLSSWLEEPDFWRSHSHPDDIESCAALFREAAERGEKREVEHRLTAADGMSVWFRTVVVPVSGENASIRLRGVMMDITEGKLAVMRLRSSDERFRLAMQGANDGVWDWNLLTDEVYYSPRWKSMLGYGDQELDNHLDTWANLTHPSDREAALALVRDYVSGRRDSYETELRMRHRDGHYVNVLSRAILSRDGQGRAVRLVGTHVDITGLKRAEEELYFARYCLDQAPVGICRFDLGMNVLYANNHACECLGYTREDLLGMSVFDFDPEFSREYLPRHLEMMRQLGCMTFETVHRSKNGDVFPVEITGTRLEYRGEELLFSFEKDISERKRTEQTLWEQEELYSAMFKQAPGGVVLIDAETMQFSEFNDMACQELGYSREEFAGLTILDINAEHPCDWHVANIRSIIDRGHSVFETVHRRKNGSLRNVRVSLRAVTIRDRCYLLTYWTDITGQIRLQEELRMREYHQRALLDNFPFSAWIKNREGRFLAANRQLATFIGLSSPKDVVGRTIYDIAPRDIADSNTENDHRVLSGGRPKHDEQQLSVLGENRWFEVYLSPVSIDGAIIGTVGCSWDITERKFIEQALRESEERHRRLVELAPDAIFVHCDGRLVFVNQAAARMLGAATPEELYGRSPLAFIHPDQREMVRRRIDNALQKRDNPPMEQLMVRLDGSSTPVEMVSIHYTHQGKDAVLAMARDISERKRVHEELVKAQKLESLGLLAGGIAHDFNNILTGILGNISLVRARLDPADPLAGRLENCEKAAMQATDLTRQLLTFARGGEPVRKVINVAPLIRESATFVLRGSNVKSDILLAEDLWCIDADAGQISQVLHNLIINAAHSMPSGGVVTISVVNDTVATDNALNLPAGAYLEIAIRDHGCGIPPENLTRIFDPYFTTKAKGSGLGLTTVYSIVKRHGGMIEVSSREGVGTTFTIHLPALPQGTVETFTSGVASMPGGCGRILVMDDEDLIRDVAREILEFAGYAVECCADGWEAVECFRRAKESGALFDAVIMDLTIPGGMGGEEAAGLLLGIDPEAVLIVSSGYANDPVMADFRRFGFSGAVVKPFNLESLTGEVRRLIGNSP